MSRRGFTLVELLVVAGIFAMLFGMVLNGVRPNVTGQVKQAAQSIASVLLATQSKALGNPSGAGVIFDPTGSFLDGTAVTSVSAADMLPMITGSCTDGMPPSNLAATSTTVSIEPDNADASDLANGYKIRFQEKDGKGVQPPSAWMSFSSNSVSFRAGNGQRPQNTIWPKPVSGGVLSVWVVRYPNKGETLYELPRTVAIDLRYSGVGDGDTFDSNWSNLSNKGAIAVAFDSVGEVDVVMQQVLSTFRSEQPLHPVSPLYLLVASRADVEADAALASERSLWIVLHPQTGRVSVSSNVAVTSKDATALRAARAKAREGIAIGK
jgi:prepilin-type N-terminal cleavage/methylation domain-containing protein